MKKILTLLLLTTIVISIEAAPKKIAENKKQTEWISTFEQVMSIFDSHYYQEVDIEGGMSEAIKTFTQQDPHSVFLDKKACKELQQKIHEEFFGIGIKLPGDKKKEAEFIPIIDITPGSPADKAGLQIGDKIVDIDNNTVKGLDIDACTNLIRGEKHTKVTLTILQENKTEPHKYTVIRDTIKDTNCTSFYFEDQNIHYFALSMFNEKSSTKIETFIKKALKAKTRGIIIDLRNNTGGLFDAALDIVNFFIPEDKLIASIKDRNEKVISQWKTKKSSLSIPKTIPCFIIVNNYTASASEILVGTLQLYAHKENIHPLFIVGTETFGKGSVQEIVPLGNGTALKMTTGLYYLPFETCIQCTGIKPDFLIEKRTEETENMKWLTATYGKENALYKSIKKRDQKKEESTEKEIELSWKEKYHKSIAQDYYIQNTVTLCNLFHLTHEKNKSYNHAETLSSLHYQFSLDRPLKLKELSL